MFVSAVNQTVLGAQEEQIASNVISQLITKQMFLCGSYFIVCRYCLIFDRAWQPIQILAIDSQLPFQTAALQMVSVNRRCQLAPRKLRAPRTLAGDMEPILRYNQGL